MCVLDDKPLPLLSKTRCTASYLLSALEPAPATCFGLAPSLDVTQRNAKFQMLSCIINSDAQMRENTASLANPKVGWVTGSGVGESFRHKLSRWLGHNTHRIHGVFYRVTFSAENEKGASSLMKSRCITMVF